MYLFYKPLQRCQKHFDTPDKPNRKEGIIIAKNQQTSNRQKTSHKQTSSPNVENHPADGPWQIYDRIFKRIFSLSKKAIIHLINGLFDTYFPPDSNVEYPNKEFVLPNLEQRIADIIVVINKIYTFHLEAQMTKEHLIVLRVFEYSFQYALFTHDGSSHLNFPEPAVIYLDSMGGIPEESILHISFGSQGSFDYRVKNFLYLAHSTEELEQKKMAVLIPFQVLRLRSLLKQWKRYQTEGRNFDMQKIYQLQEEIRSDIIDSIKMNLTLGNITADDARQLFELTNLLHEHICKDFISSGGEELMNPLLPGAIELPNDKYRLRIDELEKQVKWYADENAKYADEITKYADEITKYADKNTQYMDENARLKEQIAQLKTQIRPKSD